MGRVRDVAAPDGDLLAAVRAGLAAAADPAKAPAMQAYLKSAMPFLGVQSAERRRVVAAVTAGRPWRDRATYEATVRALWREATHREHRYAAIDVAEQPAARELRDAASLQLDDEFVVTGAWWDLVDPTASHLVGPLLLRHPAEVRPVVGGWAVDADRWRRRAAIICQLLARDRTDVALLEHAVDANLDDADFFVRKGIGWALRQYARTDAAYVRAFVAARGDRLSPLSRREALKHLG
jgi:3-methyladenine DNA glycosylase AlkD